jgi:hypothetical protein
VLSRRTDSGIILWTGANENCLPLYKHLQAFLTSHQASLLPSGSILSNSQKGNLGEFIAFRIGHENDFSDPAHRIVTNNAHDPLNTISISGLDLAYVYFHPTEPASDLLYIQEVKTTSDASLAYGDRLVTDYRKLYNGDGRTVLANRVSAIKSRLEFEHRIPDHLLARLDDIVGTSPQNTVQVYLVPTLVHEKAGANPVAKLIGVRAEIAGLGWSQSQITAWSIALVDLDEGLAKLATGSVS